MVQQSRENVNEFQNSVTEMEATLKDGRRTDWFWDYNSVFRSDLTAHAKLVRLLLAQCANNERQAWPSMKTIADACGISRATAKRAVSELVEKGWLSKTLRQKGNGEYTSNIFVLCDPPVQKAENSKQQGGRVTGNLPCNDLAEGGRVTQSLPCNEMTGGVGSHRTYVGSQGTEVGSVRTINNTNITILKEQETDLNKQSIIHPPNHHDEDDMRAREIHQEKPIVDSVDNVDNLGCSTGDATANLNALQKIAMLIKAAGFEGSQVEVEFMSRWVAVFPPEMIEHALKKAVLNGKKNLYYVEGIFDSWLEKGVRTLEEALRETRYNIKSSRVPERERSQGPEKIIKLANPKVFKDHIERRGG